MKKTVYATTLLLSMLMAACGGSDSSSGPSTPSEACSVTKAANSVTTIMHTENGASTTTYIFGADGNMTQQITETDYSAMGDAAKTACEAMNQDGFSANYEGGKCTVIQTIGLFGSIDLIYQTQVAACDAVNGSSGSIAPTTDDVIENDGKTVATLSELSKQSCNEYQTGKSFFVTEASRTYMCVYNGMSEKWEIAVNNLSEIACTESYRWKTIFLVPERQNYLCDYDPTVLGYNWIKFNQPVTLAIDPQI